MRVCLRQLQITNLSDLLCWVRHQTSGIDNGYPSTIGDAVCLLAPEQGSLSIGSPCPAAVFVSPCWNKPGTSELHPSEQNTAPKPYAEPNHNLSATLITYARHCGRLAEGMFRWDIGLVDAFSSFRGDFVVVWSLCFRSLTIRARNCRYLFSRASNDETGTAFSLQWGVLPRPNSSRSDDAGGRLWCLRIMDLIHCIDAVSAAPAHVARSPPACAALLSHHNLYYTCVFH